MGLAGIAGAILVGVFAISEVGGENKSGWIDGNPMQIWTQIEGVMVTAVWCSVVTLILLWLIDNTLGLRVSPEDEQEGLDLALHGETLHQ